MERKKKKYACQMPLLLGVISLEEECRYEQQVKQDQPFTDVGSLGGVGLGTGKYKEHEECGVDQSQLEEEKSILNTTLWKVTTINVDLSKQSREKCE